MMDRWILKDVIGCNNWVVTQVGCTCRQWLKIFIMDENIFMVKIDYVFKILEALFLTTSLKQTSQNSKKPLIKNVIHQIWSFNLVVCFMFWGPNLMNIVSPPPQYYGVSWLYINWSLLKVLVHFYFILFYIALAPNSHDDHIQQIGSLLIFSKWSLSMVLIYYNPPLCYKM